MEWALLEGWALRQHNDMGVSVPLPGTGFVWFITSFLQKTSVPVWQNLKIGTLFRKLVCLCSFSLSVSFVASHV